MKSVKVIYHCCVVFNVLDDSTTVCRENFSVDVQSIAVRGDINYSVAVNIAVGEFFKLCRSCKGFPLVAGILK